MEPVTDELAMVTMAAKIPVETTIAATLMETPPPMGVSNLSGNESHTAQTKVGW